MGAHVLVDAFESVVARVQFLNGSFARFRMYVGLVKADLRLPEQRLVLVLLNQKTKSATTNGGE